VETDTVLYAGPAGHIETHISKGRRLLWKAVPAEGSEYHVYGFMKRPLDILVTAKLFAKMNDVFQDDTSDLRRLSTRPIRRGFVFVDVSDFSKMESGMQLLIVRALVKLVEDATPWRDREAGVRKAIEAKLCIGDGYVYVLPSGVQAAHLAGFLAMLIEQRVVEAKVPPFHFRMGVHVGDVRCFHDPGRATWNYVGDGINGGNRVLSAIGKDTDDVVYVSAEARRDLLHATGHPAELIMANLENKGRRADKHNNLWRVYQLNHYAVFGHGNPGIRSAASP
jgi:class 3 adenylate cyclase